MTLVVGSQRRKRIFPPERALSARRVTGGASSWTGRGPIATTWPLPATTGRDIRPYPHRATIHVFRARKLFTTATTLVGPNRRITYTTGHLTTGTYRIQFIVAGKITKTTIVTVQKHGVGKA